MLPPDTTGIALSPDEVARFARHLILPEVGMEGQKRLKASSVLCVGTGGLGSPRREAGFTFFNNRTVVDPGPVAATFTDEGYMMVASDGEVAIFGTSETSAKLA